MNTSSTEYSEASMLNKILEYSDESPTFVGDFVECMRIFYATNRTHSYYEVAKWVDGQGEFELDGFLNSIVQISAKLSNQIDNDNRENYSFYLKMLRKLSDHIQLEVFREEKEAIILNRTKEAENKLKLALNALEENQNTMKMSIQLLKDSIALSRQLGNENQQLVEEIEKAKQDLNKAAAFEKESVRKLDKSTKKLDSAEMGYISTLGIFAGIVMAFAGVFSFTSSAFENISSLNFWMLCFLLVIAIFGLVNLIYWLFHCVGILLKREKNHCCKDYIEKTTSLEEASIPVNEHDCSNCEKKSDCKKIKKGWVHLDNTYIIVNLLFFFVIIFFGVCVYNTSPSAGTSDNPTNNIEIINNN